MTTCTCMHMHAHACTCMCVHVHAHVVHVHTQWHHLLVQYGHERYSGAWTAGGSGALSHYPHTFGSTRPVTTAGLNSRPDPDSILPPPLAGTHDPSAEAATGKPTGTTCSADDDRRDGHWPVNITICEYRGGGDSSPWFAAARSSAPCAARVAMLATSTWTASFFQLCRHMTAAYIPAK